MQAYFDIRKAYYYNIRAAISWNCTSWTLYLKESIGEDDYSTGVEHFVSIIEFAQGGWM